MHYQENIKKNFKLVSIMPFKKFVSSSKTCTAGNSSSEKSKTSEKKKLLIHTNKNSNVEILNPPKLICKLPEVKVESNLIPLNINGRIHSAVGVSTRTPILLKPEELSCEPMVMGRNLNEPKIQSSVVLMRNLDRLKSLEIETQSLLLLKFKTDKKTQNILNSKTLGVLNRAPTEIIYSHLQPLSLNVEQMVKLDERKRYHLAGKCALRKRERDPEVSLKNFITNVPNHKMAFVILPEMSFLAHCLSYHINPFDMQQTPQNTNLTPYVFWSN